jgi:hypothetical protein
MKAAEAVQRILDAHHEMIYGWASGRTGNHMYVVWSTDTGVVTFAFGEGKGHVLIEVRDDERRDVVFATKPVALARLDSQSPPERRRWLADNLPGFVRDSQGMVLAKDENLRNRWYAKFRLQPVRDTTPYLKICVDLVGSSASWSVEYLRYDGCILDEVRVETRYAPLRRVGNA